MHKRIISLSFVAVSTLAASGAVAQSQKGLEEITVTARKRTESLQDVPVAVTAISQSSLQNNVANDLNKIAELAPQMMVGRSVTGTGAVLTIRGISSSPVDSGLDQSVSMSIDGVSLSRGRIIQTAMFDMQQVEVLQGPQALFFGKNSPAGVISITSVDPTDNLEGYVKGAYEFKAEEKTGEAAIGGRIAGNLKARLAFRYSHMNGWTKNIAPAIANPFQPFAPLPGAVNGQETRPKGSNTSGRLTLLFEPSDDFTAKFKLTMNRERLNSMSGYNEPFCLGGQARPLVFGVPQPNNDCAANMVQALGNLPPALAVNYPNGNGGVPYERSDLALASLTLNKTIGDITLTSTTGYYDQSHKGAYGAGLDEFVQIFDAEAERFRQLNQELRLNTNFEGAVNGMVGLYYEHSDRRWINVPNLFNLFNTRGQNYTSVTATSNSDNNSYSAFGQIRWKFLPTLELAGGLRYTHDDKKTTLIERNTNPALGALGLALYPDDTPINGRFKGNNVSPEVTLTWKPDSDQTLYAAYKTGYKAGGISNGGIVAAGTTRADLEFGPEKVKGFEVGYKAHLLSNSLRVDITGYRYNYDGLQVTSAVAFRYFIRNAAKARTYGVAGSFEWLATDSLSFNGNIGWNKARYLSFPNAQCYVTQTAAQGCVGGVQNLAGSAPNRAPNVTFNIGANYQANIFAGWTADFSLSGTYTGSYQTNTNYGPGGIQPSYWLLNAAVHIQPEGEKYQLSVIGRNLANEYYKVTTYQSNYTPATEYNSFFNRPREVVIQLSYTF